MVRKATRGGFRDIDSSRYAGMSTTHHAPRTAHRTMFAPSVGNRMPSYIGLSVAIVFLLWS